MRARLLLILGALTAALGSCDPVREQQIDSLGGEAPGIPQGPLHRAGQPCLVCHGEGGPEGPTMSVAGTVYRTRRDRTGVLGAVVTIKDARGETRTYSTNEVGTFYVEASHWTPVYPLRVSVSHGGTTAEMETPINGEGSCGACHRDPAAADSVGHVFVEDEVAR